MTNPLMIRAVIPRHVGDTRKKRAIRYPDDKNQYIYKESPPILLLNPLSGDPYMFPAHCPLIAANKFLDPDEFWTMESIPERLMDNGLAIPWDDVVYPVDTVHFLLSNFVFVSSSCVVMLYCNLIRTNQVLADGDGPGLAWRKSSLCLSAPRISLEEADVAER